LLLPSPTSLAGIAEIQADYPGDPSVALLHTQARCAPRLHLAHPAACCQCLLASAAAFKPFEAPLPSRCKLQLVFFRPLGGQAQRSPNFSPLQLWNILTEAGQHEAALEQAQAAHELMLSK
jgi:hypothetical protein